MTKSQRRKLNRKVRGAKVRRYHINRPSHDEFVEGDLISQVNDLRGLMVESRGNEAIPAFRDYLTVWNAHAHQWNNRAAVEKAAKLIDYER